jgi:preprotein translocase subunit SecA
MPANADLLPVPGIVLGAYPEREVSVKGAFEAATDRVRAVLPRRADARYAAFLRQVEAADAALGTLDSVAIDAHLRATRAAMAREGLGDARVAAAFALVRRVFVRELGLALFSTQLIAARIMLDGQLAEMATGEGKTLAAGLCAATAALAGIPVHLITANEYLVQRDADTLRPLYVALGLTVGTVVQAMNADARARAYDCDIVYCTASELVFDYLRDGLARSRTSSDLQQRVQALGAQRAGGRTTLLRGLCMAVVDEADSILIDDARVPLILSARAATPEENARYPLALMIARSLVAGDHYALHREGMHVTLTDAGRAFVDAEPIAAAWRNRLHRDETICTALAALHLYERDRDYLVREGAVEIVDQTTGRVAEGRVWSRGLHRLIELKEGCEAGADTVTVAQITYQRFFQRYLALCGMSATLNEARSELLSTYGLPVVKVPLREPSGRRVLPTRLYPDRESQMAAVVREALHVSASGRPVLIGTDSVAESETLSLRLAKENAPHAVLNARQDSAEAAIIARAGEPGQITVATNMAGRGTDIALAGGIAQAGGLHVISCQHNAARRIDRQLIGRCARRGDPGSAQTLLALDKPLIARLVPAWFARRMPVGGIDAPQWLVRLLVRAPQVLEENRRKRQRRALLQQELHFSRRPTFGRPME